MTYKKEDFTIVTLYGEDDDAEMWMYTDHAYNNHAFKAEIRIEHFLPFEGENEKIFAMLYPQLIEFVKKGLEEWDSFHENRTLMEDHYYWLGKEWA